MHTLKKRKDFLRISKSNIKYITDGFVVQMGYKISCKEYRIGYSASRIIGNAVKRNKAKRILRSLANKVILKKVFPCYECILIARKKILILSWPKLMNDMIGSFHCIQYFKIKNNTCT